MKRPTTPEEVKVAKLRIQHAVNELVDAMDAALNLEKFGYPFPLEFNSPIDFIFMQLKGSAGAFQVLAKNDADFEAGTLNLGYARDRKNKETEK